VSTARWQPADSECAREECSCVRPGAAGAPAGGQGTMNPYTGTSSLATVCPETRLRPGSALKPRAGLQSLHGMCPLDMRAAEAVQG
jgi:hypothetical protein